MDLAGTRPVVVSPDPPTSNGAADDPPVTPPPAAKVKRARITSEQIAEVRRLKASGMSFKAVSAATGVSIGSIQKFVAEPGAKKAKAKAAKAPARKAVKAKPAARAKRTPRAAAAAPEVRSDLISSTQIPSLTVKAALFDLMQKGITPTQIRDVLAGF